MSKTIFSRVLWAGGARAFTVALAVILALMLGIAAMAMSATWLSGTAVAQQQGGTIVTVFAKHSGKVLDVRDASTADGALIQQWTWHGGPNQQFRLRRAGGGYYTLVARHSGKCLDVQGASTADGALIQQWTCHGGPNQQFRPQRASGGYYTLVARHSGKCLDVEGASTADGARVLQWTCHGGPNQQWLLAWAGA